MSERSLLENRFKDLCLGEIDLTGLPDESLENLVNELESENLNLEELEDINKLNDILSKYF